MKNSLLIHLLFLIVFSGNAQPINDEIKVNLLFNFEAVDGYFTLVDKVKSGDTITAIDWERFFNIEGNRLYIDENNISNTTLNLIKQEIETVYHPEHESLLTAFLPNDLRLQIRNRYKVKEELYKNHLLFLKNHTYSLEDSIVNLTRAYLPTRMHELNRFPNVYFHALWDGSASDKGIFVDIILEYDFDQKRLGSFIAHELHHYMRTSILEGIEIDSTDKGIIWAIESTFNEGLADMVDKSALIYEGSDWWLNEQYMALLNYASGVITELDTLIQDELKGDHHSEDDYRETLAYSVGHIPGQFMAQVIKENGRLDEIIESADNPFLFFLIYNENATQLNDDDIPHFSEESIGYLLELNNQYIARQRERN